MKRLLIHSLMQNIKSLFTVLSMILCMVSLTFLGWTTPAIAALNDDHYDGNIFALYAGNGSLIPPRQTLSEALISNRPTLLMFYVDDSSDCKVYSPVISQIDAFYGRNMNLIPLSVDAIVPQASYNPDNPGYYYKGAVPQTVILDAAGKVVFDRPGILDYETIDDRLRQVFDLLPRSESVPLKRRQVNEQNVEFVPE
jgi:hypothetical protein